MNVAFAAPGQPKTGVLVIFCPENKKLLGVAADIDKRTGGHISKAIKAISLEAKRQQILDLVAPDKVSFQRIIVAGLGDPDKIAAREVEFLGGAVAGYLQSAKVESALIAADIPVKDHDAATLAALLASGAKLRIYSFDRYKSKKSGNAKGLASLTVLTSQAARAKKVFADYQAVAEGVHFARDLVNEPANKLNPVEFARRVKVNGKSGLVVEILTPAQMKRLGMGALLGVAQGSANEPRLVVMRWQGGKRGDKPVAFVGKGVTFDTGGISIKQAAGMEDMKGDMGGAACVTGLMLALARR